MKGWFFKMEYKFSDKVSKLQASAIREILKFTADPEVISFAAGNPAPEAFPKERIAEELGFVSPNYMISSFFHYYRQTPDDYRNSTAR